MPEADEEAGTVQNLMAENAKLEVKVSWRSGHGCIGMGTTRLRVRVRGRVGVRVRPHALLQAPVACLRVNWVLHGTFLIT